MRSWVGEGVKRLDGVEKVTGQAKFIDDLPIKACIVKVVRSTCAHGLIKRLDTSRAAVLPGVVGVITGTNPLVKRIGMCLEDQTPLAVDKVRYHGEPVACIVACDAQTASRAVKLVEVEYEDLPPLLDAEKAYHQSEILIHPGLGEYRHLAGFFPQPGTNVFHHFKIRRGDMAATMAQADMILDNRFEIPLVQHVQIEPHGALGIYNPGEGMLMHSSTQAPFIVRETLSRLLEMPLAAVHIRAPYLGGGFGGKSDVTIEPLLGLVLKAFPDKWCKLVLDREEVFTGTVIGRGLTGYYRTALSRDGVLLGAEIKLFWNGGGYGDYAVNIVTGGGVSACGPYEIPNLTVDSYGVYTNTPPVGAYRGYGHPETHWCMERHMDSISRELGLPPVELRLKNCLGPGKINAIGQIISGHNGDLAGCIQRTAEILEKDKPYDKNEHRKKGWGIAAFGKFPVMPTNAQSGATVRVNSDGTLCLATGAVEMGQGLNTAMAQILATALGVEVDRVTVQSGVDTDSSPYEWQTVASHSTWAVGNAVLKAAADLIHKWKTDVTQLWGCTLADVVYSEGWVEYKAFGIKLRVEELGTDILGAGCFEPSGLSYLDGETGQGNLAADWTFGCQGAEIEILDESGEIRINKLVTVIDAGRIINKQLAAEQIKGAMVQALGATLYEQLIFSSTGELRNGDLVDYKIPTAADIPGEMLVEFVETPETTGPFGARGLGEHGAVAVAPAIANAVLSVLNGEVVRLNISRERVIGMLCLDEDEALRKVVREGKQ